MNNKISQKCQFAESEDGLRNARSPVKYHIWLMNADVTWCVQKAGGRPVQCRRGDSCATEELAQDFTTYLARHGLLHKLKGWRRGLREEWLYHVRTSERISRHPSIAAFPLNKILCVPRTIHLCSRKPLALAPDSPLPTWLYYVLCRL